MQPFPITPEQVQTLIVALGVFLLTQWAKTPYDSNTARGLIAGALAVIGTVALGIVTGQLLPFPARDPGAILSYLLAHYVYVYGTAVAFFHLIYKPIQTFTARGRKTTQTTRA